LEPVTKIAQQKSILILEVKILMNIGGISERVIFRQEV
jgi:hypothetical protein